MASRTPILAIVGRPNVGKSTFFNRVVRQRRAIVEDIPGVTRDRNYAHVERYSVPFHLVDTGGFEADPEDPLQAKVTEQAIVAVEEADVVLVLLDGKSGLHPDDPELIKVLRRYDKPQLFLVNKCDGVEQNVQLAEFYALGVEELLPVTALHGRGVEQAIEAALAKLPDYAELKSEQAALAEREEAARQEAALQADDDDDDVDEGSFADDELSEEIPDEAAAAPEPSFTPVFVPGESGLSEAEYLRRYKTLSLAESRPKELPAAEAEDEELSQLQALEEIRPVPLALQAPPEQITVAIIGRPNAGKSTLLNTLVGEERAITSPLAGTTRDALYFTVTRDGQKYQLIDTAGLRKKGKVSNKLERYSTLRALSAITECDVAVVLIDAVEGPSEQDGKIVGLAHEEGKGIVIVINKWDLVEKDHRVVQDYKQRIEDAFKFAPYAPLLFVSALTGKRCPKVLETVQEVARQRLLVAPTGRLNQLLQRAARRVSAPSYRGRPVKLYFAAQVAQAPPRFVLFFNYPREVHFSYLRFLKNAIRKEFGFLGTDIKLVTRKKK